MVISFIFFYNEALQPYSRLFQRLGGHEHLCGQSQHCRVWEVRAHYLKVLLALGILYINRYRKKRNCDDTKTYRCFALQLRTHPNLSPLQL
jgi:hypothetical protein